MTHYDFGDVILVGFPFTNLQTVKKRPAVILSNETYNKNRPDVILMAISSKIRHPQEIGENQIVNWDQAGLIKPSVFKPLITTVEQTQAWRCRDVQPKSPILPSHLNLTNCKTKV